MTYILNAISVKATTTEPFVSGSLIAELDEPPAAEMLVYEGVLLEGVRYLIVSDDGSGYLSSRRFVNIPGDVESPATLRINPEDRDAFETVLRRLISWSPERKIILYLEANRQISRPDPSDEHPLVPRLKAPILLIDFLQSAHHGHVQEEDVFVVAEF